MRRHRDKLDAALQELRRQVEAVVREEQLRDQLTGLVNGLALSELLQSIIESNQAFWCAFVEVDFFKRINDQFSYQVADGLLQKIAKRLEAFEDYIPGTVPVRAHGDEFYLFGQLNDDGIEEKIHAALDRVREEISGISVPTEHGEMRCTVSVGWLTSRDAGDEVLTERLVLRHLEAAVGAANIQGRDRIVRYSPEVRKAQRRSVRDDCASCNASFTVEIPTDTDQTGELYCPNCGATRPRP